MSNISVAESSIQDGQPLECYLFYCAGVKYAYTSARYDIELPEYDDSGAFVGTNTFFADYIDRSALRPSCSNDTDNVSITVSKDNPIAKLFELTPPEKGMLVVIYRLHAQDQTKFDKTFTGNVSQATFEDSHCTLSINMGSWLNKQLPNMMKQYTCCNVLFDTKCRLNAADYIVPITVQLSDNHMVQSPDFANYPDGYFTNGKLVFMNTSRMIRSHKGDTVIIQYPFSSIPVSSVVAYPGCPQTFKACATKYNNYLNFSGCPYVRPTDPTTTNVGNGVYWEDTGVVRRDTDCYIGTISM